MEPYGSFKRSNMRKRNKKTVPMKETTRRDITIVIADFFFYKHTVMTIHLRGLIVKKNTFEPF